MHDSNLNFTKTKIILTKYIWKKLSKVRFAVFVDIFLFLDAALNFHLNFQFKEIFGC